MDERIITLIVASVIIIGLLLVSYINKKFFHASEHNKHLKTYDDDTELYFYKKTNDDSLIYKNMPIENEKKVIDMPSENKPDDSVKVENSEEYTLEGYFKNIDELKDTSIVNTENILSNDIILHIYTLEDLHNSNLFTQYEKSFVVNRIKDLINNKAYNSTFCIFDSNTNNLEKSILLNDDLNGEKDVMKQILQHVVSNSNYIAIYIGTFGILKENVSDVFDIY